MPLEYLVALDVLLALQVLQASQGGAPELRDEVRALGVRVHALVERAHGFAESGDGSLGVPVGHEEEHLMGRGDDAVPTAGDAALGDEDGARVGGGDARVAVGGVAVDVAGELVEDEDERDGGFGGGVRPRVERAGLGGGERGGEAGGHSLVRRALRGAVLVPRGEPLALVVLLRMGGGEGGGG